MKKLIRFILLFTSVALLTAACDSGKMKSITNKSKNRGRMTFRSEPSGAQITIQGKMIGVTPRETNPVRTGMYVVKFEKTGYHTEWRPVTVEAGKNIVTDVKLRPITSVAMITSTPRGAQVFKNGKVVGITPCLLTGLSAGMHKVRLQHTGTVPQEVAWEVNSDRPFMTHVTMLANTGTLKITSDPRDAKIYIDGEEKGLTPFDEKIEQGDHEIKVAKNGYETYIKNITLKRNGTETIHALLKMQPIQLVITSQPEGAMVKVNGKTYGLTPYTFQTREPGKYSVEVTKDNFGAEERKITLEPGNPYKMDFVLSSQMGSVEFITEPARAEVYIDGKKIGKTEPDPNNPNLSKIFRVNDLLQGIHTLEIVHRRGTPPSLKRKFRITQQEVTRISKPLSLWVPNVVLVHKRGWRMTGRVRDLKQDPIILETKRGISSGYAKSDIESIELIKDAED